MTISNPNIDNLSSDAFIALILGASGVFFMLTVTMVVIVVIRRYRMNGAKVKETVLTQKYQDYLSEFISIPDLETDMISSSGHQETIRLSAQDLSHKGRRSMLSNEIYEFHKQLDGHQADQIRQLYLGFSFFESTERKLQSRNWADIVRGIDEARQFELRELIPLVKKHVHHKNLDVRCQAIIAMISFDGGKLSILESIPTEFNNWERHKILYTLQENNVQFDYSENQSDAMAIHDDFLKEIDAQLNPSVQLHPTKMITHV